MKPLAFRALGLALLILPLAAAHAATLGDYPSDKTCEDDRNRSYAEGFAAGDANGYNRGYPEGYSAGFAQGSAQQLAQCFADPQSCGITLESCLPDPAFGETEPNDSFISADPLQLSANFWGQSYGAADQDWFYTETTKPNQNLVINFSVPDWIEGADLASGEPSTWNLTVRDAAGNVFANFDTDVLGSVESPKNAMTYTATLGLVGTYYLVVQQSDPNQNNAYTYGLAAFLQDSPLETGQPIVGFYDSEIEPNDVPSRGTPLATGVSMYGLVNLTFNNVVPDPEDPDGDTFFWSQGEEDDWYVYQSSGNEIITLVFCAKERCGPGDWWVEVYDRATAQRIEAGADRVSVRPLLAFNTDTASTGSTSQARASSTFRLGLRDPGYYFMRITHKRLFLAPCARKQFVSTSAQGGFTGSCECDDLNSCYLPADCASDPGLACQNVPTSCVVGVEVGCFFIEESPPGCNKPDPADPNGKITAVCDTYQTQALCSCSQYGAVLEVPDTSITSPYNFTWHGTKLPPNTIDTDAYKDYLNRPSPYN